MRALSIIFLLFFSFHFLSGSDIKDAKAVLNEANQAFEAKKYDEAINLYTSLVNDYESAPLYHNLSLSHYYQGNLAESILYMEKANKIAPLNRDINKNLKLLEENVDSEISRLPDFFLKAWLDSVSKIASISTWLWLHIITLIIAIVLLYFYLIKGNDFNLHFYYIRGVIIGLFILSLILGGISFNRSQLKNDTRSAIIMQDSVPLRMGAEANSQEVMKANQGVKVKIEDEIGDFYKVKLQDYTEAWLKKEFVEII